MKKPVVRQLKKIKGSNELVVCVPPEIRDKIGSTEGDNLLFGSDSDSGVVKLSKVVQPNPGLDNVLDETHRISEYKSRADEVDEEAESQDEITKFKFCTICGSDDIQVTGNHFYCGDCDVTYEVTPKGTKVVGINSSENSNDIESWNKRLDRLEQDVIELKNNSVNNADEDEELLNQGFIRFGSEDTPVVVDAGSENDADANEDEERDGFITW